MEIGNESALPALPFPCRSALEARLQCWHLRPYPVFDGFCTWLRSFQRSPHQVAEVGLALGSLWLALPYKSLSSPNELPMVARGSEGRLIASRSDFRTPRRKIAPCSGAALPDKNGAIFLRGVRKSDRLAIKRPSDPRATIGNSLGDDNDLYGNAKHRDPRANPTSAT